MPTSGRHHTHLDARLYFPQLRQIEARFGDGADGGSPKKGAKKLKVATSRASSPAPGAHLAPEHNSAMADFSHLMKTALANRAADGAGPVPAGRRLCHARCRHAPPRAGWERHRHRHRHRQAQTGTALPNEVAEGRQQVRALSRVHGGGVAGGGNPLCASCASALSCRL